MKILKGIIAMAFVGLLAIACQNAKKEQTETKAASKELAANFKKIELNIEGMTCEIGCAKMIQSKLSKVEGIKTANVSFDDKLGMVEYDANKISSEEIAQNIQGIAGGDTYKVTGSKNVEAFTKGHAKKCGTDCKKACCADKKVHESKVKCSEDCTKENCPKCEKAKAECKAKCEAKKAQMKA